MLNANLMSKWFQTSLICDFLKIVLRIVEFLVDNLNKGKITVVIIKLLGLSLLIWLKLELLSTLTYSSSTPYPRRIKKTYLDGAPTIHEDRLIKGGCLSSSGHFFYFW